MTPFPSPRPQTDPIRGDTAAAVGPTSGGGGDAAILVELLTAQRHHYRQLKDLSDRQRRLVDEGRVEQLLGVLGERQGHVDALGDLNRRLSPHRASMTSVAERADPQTRDTLRTLVDEVQQLLDQIIRQDEQDKDKLAAGRDKVRDQMQKVRMVPTARAAYGVTTAAPAPRFADRRG